MTDLEEAAPDLVIERGREHGRRADRRRADQVGEQNDRPEAADVCECLRVAVLEQRQDRRQRVLGEELLPAEDHRDEAEAIAELRHQRPPRRVGKVGHEQAFAEHREAH